MRVYTRAFRLGDLPRTIGNLRLPFTIKSNALIGGFAGVVFGLIASIPFGANLVFITTMAIVGMMIGQSSFSIAKASLWVTKHSASSGPVFTTRLHNKPATVVTLPRDSDPPAGAQLVATSDFHNAWVVPTPQRFWMWSKSAKVTVNGRPLNRFTLGDPL